MSKEKEKQALEAAKQASSALDPGAPKRIGGAIWGFVKWLVGTIVLLIIYTILRVLLS